MPSWAPEKVVQEMFGQRLARGARQQFELKLTNLSYLKKVAKDPEPGMEVDLTFGISPDSEAVGVRSEAADEVPGSRRRL